MRLEVGGTEFRSGVGGTSRTSGQDARGIHVLGKRRLGREGLGEWFDALEENGRVVSQQQSGVVPPLKGKLFSCCVVHVICGAG